MKEYFVFKELSEAQMELISGGMPAGLKGNMSQSQGVVLAIGVVQPNISLSVVVIAATVINDPLTINVTPGVHIYR